jgi:gliding motility-associated-like protein
MKAIILLNLLTFCTYSAVGQAFITTWKTDNPGISAPNQITIPTTGTGYSYSIYWEEIGNVAVNGTIAGPIFGSIAITFPYASIYRVHITGAFPRIYFNGNGLLNSDYEKILTVEQWGNIMWTSMAHAFDECKNLTIPATDAPNLSEVTDMSWMFEGATNFNEPVEHWDVSHVTNMYGMFSRAENFNQPLDQWDVSHVTSMGGMFSFAIAFNQPIGSWDVSNVTDMSFMFNGAQNFNQPIGLWNVGKVTNMMRLFSEASVFNQSIGDWDVGNVTDMSSMFMGIFNPTIFNQPIDNWNVRNVKDMSAMFSSAINFNRSIGNWNTGNATNMAGMFGNATSFNQPIGAWNTGKVTDMSYMFSGAENFNQPIGTWDVSNVTSTLYMFNFAIAFNQPLENWNVSKVTDMLGMFNAAVSFNQPIDKWDVSQVKDMFGMFQGATAFNQPLGNWNVSNTEVMFVMFSGATSFNQSLKNWNISNVISMALMLNNTSLSTSNYDETLISWAAQNVKPNVPLGAQGLTYCLGADARAQLVSKGWVITGDISLVPATPVLDVIQPVCFESTGTITITVQSPTDTYSFDGGVTFQTSNVKDSLSPGKYSVIIKNEEGCLSAAQQVLINEPFQRSPAPVLSGSPIVCPNILAVDYSANIAEYSYQWFIEGGTLQSQQNNQITVNWGPTNFNAYVKAVGFDQHNCPTDTAVFPVKVQIQLKPATPEGFDSVCYNFRAGVPYQTSYTNGSIYTWFTNGGLVAEGQPTSNVKIDWANLGEYQLWVKEENTTSTDYCEGYSDTLSVTVFQDMAAITMNFVSVDYDDDRNVQLQWDISLLERVSDLIIVSRRIAGTNDPWTVVATLEKNVQSFLDQNVATSTNIYEYKVEGFNKCDEGLQSVIHNTIRLDGYKVEEEELINLNWNDYNGWDEVEHYEVWRKLDDEEMYKLIDVTPGDLTAYTGKHGADGFVHHLRIKAKKKGANTISWSNEIVLDFENPIDFIPNVITPNGDAKNDFFVIPKLHLYPDNALMVYDRWGLLVFSKKNYDNTWNAEGLSGGVYFYSFIINGTKKNLKGWIQVIR